MLILALLSGWQKTAIKVAISQSVLHGHLSDNDVRDCNGRQIQPMVPLGYKPPLNLWVNFDAILTSADTPAEPVPGGIDLGEPRRGISR